jgi:hypothetical protein
MNWSKNTAGLTSTPMRTLGSQPQRPDQSVTVMPRVGVPVSSTSTVAARVATSCGPSSNATAAARGLDADEQVRSHSHYGPTLLRTHFLQMAHTRTVGARQSGLCWGTRTRT